MEFPEEERLAAEEAPIEINKENIDSMITSRNCKHRIAAYAAISDYPEYIKIVQNETQVVAMEAALEALLTYQGALSLADVSKCFLMLAQPKASIRSKLAALLDIFIARQPEETAQEILGLLSNKNPRLVERAVILLSESTERLSRPAHLSVCRQLPLLLGAADPGVKRAAVNLAVSIYKAMHDEIFPFIADVKPILLNEIRELCRQFPVPKKPVRIGDLPFADPLWKERLAALNILKASLMDPKSPELIGILARALADPNLQVVTAAVECAQAGAFTSPEIVRRMADRLRDKRPALSRLIKETIAGIRAISPGTVDVLIDALDQKNPDIKMGVLETLTDEPGDRTVDRAADIAALLDDPNSHVRTAAARLLSQCDQQSLTADCRAKLSRLQPQSQPVRVAQPQPVRVARRQEAGAHDAVAHTPSPARLSTGSASSRLDDFLEKYPIFSEREWDRRLELIRENMNRLRREPIHILIDFMLHSKESNFNILRVMLGLLMEHGSISEAGGQLFPLLYRHALDPKLNKEAVAIFRTTEYGRTVEYLIRTIRENPIGKKFVVLLEILQQVLRGENKAVENMLRQLWVHGVTERMALDRFKKAYVVVGRGGTSAGAGVSAADGPAACEGGARAADAGQDGVEAVAAGSTHTANTAHTAQGMRTVEGTRIFAHPPADSLNSFAVPLESVFSAEYLRAVDTDPYRAILALDQADHIALSSAFIRLYIRFSLPAAYFNSLLLRFVARRYILREEEAGALVGHLLGNSMETELGLVDRIYPVTKLYGVYRGIVLGTGGAGCHGDPADAVSEVMKLIKKYKKSVKEIPDNLEETIRRSEDFLALINNCNGCERGVCVSVDAVAVVAEAPQQTASSESSEILDMTESFIVENNPEALADCFADASATAGTAARDDSLLRAPSLLCDEVATARQPEGVHQSSTSLLSHKQHSHSFSHSHVVDSALERSLENISISSTPRKKKRDLGQLDLILSMIVEKNPVVSKEAIRRLNAVVESDIGTLLFSSNSIVGSLTIQLFDQFSNPSLKSLILQTLLRLSQNGGFCQSLRFETLRSVNTDLVKLVSQDTVAADILINLCLNCSVDILRVYFDLLDGYNEIVMKLIWRHAKQVNYGCRAAAAAVVRIVDDFYRLRGRILYETPNDLVTKICLIHIKDCCLHYSDGVVGFGVGEQTRRIVGLLLSGNEINLGDIREVFK